MRWPSYFSLLRTEVQHSHDLLWPTHEYGKMSHKADQAILAGDKMVHISVSPYHEESPDKLLYLNMQTLVIFHNCVHNFFPAFKQQSKDQLMRAEVLRFSTTMAMIFMKWKSASDTESPSHERSTELSEALPRMLNTVTPTDIYSDQQSCLIPTSLDSRQGAPQFSPFLSASQQILNFWQTQSRLEKGKHFQLKEMTRAWKKENLSVHFNKGLKGGAYNRQFSPVLQWYRSGSVWTWKLLTTINPGTKT